MKRIGIGVLATLILAGIVAFAWSASRKNREDEDISRKSDRSNLMTIDIPKLNLTPPPPPVAEVPETPEPPIDPDAWEFSLATDEVTASSGTIRGDAIYAVKEEYRSTVYERDLQHGTQTKLFGFDEDVKADASTGNLWDGLPPNVALSPNRGKMAFIDKDGLKVRDLRTGAVKTLISEVGEPEPDCEVDCPPKWSISSIVGTYHLARPLWSSDGRFISFLQALYEGASFGIIDAESGAYSALKGVGGGYSNLSWSPVGRAYVKASSGGYEGSGLLISSQSDITQAENLALKFGMTEETPFEDASFSPDGKKIVFAFYEPYDAKHLAIVNRDGTGFAVLAEKTDARTPVFSADGHAVLYLQKKHDRQVLVRLDLATGKPADLAILPPEFDRWEKPSWTTDGFLSLVGLSSSSALTLGGVSARMLILDLAAKKVIYASPTHDLFTTFAGFSD